MFDLESPPLSITMLLNVRKLLKSTAGCCLQHQAQCPPCMAQWLGCVHVDAARFLAGGHRHLATQPGPAGSFTVRLMSTSSAFNLWSVLIDWPGSMPTHSGCRMGLLPGRAQHNLQLHRTPPAPTAPQQIRPAYNMLTCMGGIAANRSSSTKSRTCSSRYLKPDCSTW